MLLHNMSLYTDYKVRQYLINRYGVQIRAQGLAPEQVPDDFDLLKEGIIDSLGIMELVTDVEVHFGHSIDFEELDAEQMTILGPLAAHIQRKLTEAQAGKSSDDFSLSRLPTDLVKLKGNSIEVWLALDDRAIRRGLMGVQDCQLAPLANGVERGMLFVFRTEQPLSFWMYKMIVPLDIVYLDASRRVINNYSAQPGEVRLLYPALRPAQYVLEIKAGLVSRWGVEPGETLQMPAELAAKSSVSLH